MDASRRRWTARSDRQDGRRVMPVGGWPPEAYRAVLAPEAIAGTGDEGERCRAAHLEPGVVNRWTARRLQRSGRGRSMPSAPRHQRRLVRETDPTGLEVTPCRRNNDPKNFWTNRSAPIGPIKFGSAEVEPLVPPLSAAHGCSAQAPQRARSARGAGFRAP